MVALPHPRTGHRELAGVPHGAAADPIQRRDRGGARGPILGCAAERQPPRVPTATQGRIHPGAALSGTVSAWTAGVTTSERRDKRRLRGGETELSPRTEDWPVCRAVTEAYPGQPLRTRGRSTSVSDSAITVYTG